MASAKMPSAMPMTKNGFTNRQRELNFSFQYATIRQNIGKMDTAIQFGKMREWNDQSKWPRKHRRAHTEKVKPQGTRAAEFPETDHRPNCADEENRIQQLRTALKRKSRKKRSVGCHWPCRPASPPTSLNVGQPRCEFQMTTGSVQIEKISNASHGPGFRK